MNVEKQLTTAQLSERLAKELNSKADAEALLINSGLITQKELEENATIKVTAAKINEAVANGTLSASDAGVIAGTLGITGVNTGATISFDLLTASIWANIKALGTWLVTNPIGWAILGGTAIFGLVKAYDALTDSVEEVKERTDALLETYNSAISEANSNAQTIESLASRYEKLSKGVNNLGENVSLTADEYSEYNDIVNQIADMFPTMITGYTDEGNAILSLKGNVEELRDAYKEAQKEAYNLLIVSGKDSDGNDIITNYQNQVHGNESWLSKQSSYIDGEAGAKDAIEIITKLTGALTPDEFRETYNQLYEEYKNIWNSDKIQEALKSSGFEELTHAPKWSEITVEDLAKVKYSAQATIQTYNAEIDSQLKNMQTLANAYLMTNSDYEKLDEQSKTAASLLVNSINENIANKFSSKEDVGAYVGKLVASISDNKEVQDALKELFTMDTSDMSVDEVKTAVDSYTTTIATAIEEDPIELKTRLGFDDSDTQPLINNVKEKLQDDFDDKVGELTLEELHIAAEQVEVPEGTLLSWDELIAKIKEVQSSTLNIENPILSLDEAKSLINGTDDVVGLIEEYELLQEVMSDTGNIQEETYEKLLSCSSKYATAIRTENGRITVNTSKLKAVAKSRQMDTKEAIRQTLALKKQEWVQWNLDIENYNGTLLDNIKANYENIDSLQAEITQYELLSNSIDVAADSFKNFKAAQSTNEQENYDTAQDAFNLVKDTLYNPESEFYGKTNTDDFRIGIESIASEKMYRKLLNAKDQEEYLRISKEIVKTLEPLFGENGGKNLDSLFEKANKIIDSGEIPKNDKEWADRLDISEDAFQAVKEHANLYQFNGNEYFGSGFTNTLDEYQSKLSNVKSAQDALNGCTDKTSNEYIRLCKELDSAKEKYNEYTDSTAKSLEEAYQSYISSGETQNGTFADYLKESMDFDEDDITGSIDVLIDRMDLLKDKMNLAEHASNSNAFEEYKKQFEELSELASVLGYKIDDSNNSKNVTYSDDGTDGMTVAINKYKELREQAQQYEETLKNSEAGSDAYNEAAQNLEQIYTLMASINSSEFRIELRSNINEIDAEIEELDTKISNLRTAMSQASNPTAKNKFREELNSAINQKKELVNQKSELEQTFKIVVDDKEFLSKMKEAQDAEIEDKSFKITADIDKALSDIEIVERKKLSPKPLIIETVLKDTAGVGIGNTSTGSAAQTGSVKPTGKSSTKANGTVNSFAQGTGTDVSIKKDEKALVNELGEEGIVRNGKLIPVKGGAQFIKLKRGDIIFNHKQMEQLKKNGYTTGRGELIGAHADGTVNAYNGLNTYTTYNKHLVDRDWQHNPANPKNAVKQTQQAVEQAAEETAEEIEEVSEEIFDWIERRIQKFQRLFDKWVKQAETALTSGFITKYYKKATAAIKKELSTYSKAYNRYMKEANKVGLDSNYAKKVRSGTIDIETIQDEELAEKIQKYQEWYIYYAPLSGNRWRHSI